MMVIAINRLPPHSSSLFNKPTSVISSSHFQSQVNLSSRTHSLPSIQAVAQGIPTYFYSMSDLNPYSQENEGFLAYLWTVGNQTYPPLVHSLSYGDDEAVVFDPARPGAIEYGLRCDQGKECRLSLSSDIVNPHLSAAFCYIHIFVYAVYTSSVQSMFIFQNCLCETAAVRRHYDLYPDTVHFPSALKRMEMEFVKMGLRGLSVLFASGDYGAGNFDTGSSRCSKAWPDWPASSPFITSVGGTQLSTEYLPLCTQSSVRIYCR